jgi:hypothetical protein
MWIPPQRGSRKVLVGEFFMVNGVLQHIKKKPDYILAGNLKLSWPATW